MIWFILGWWNLTTCMIIMGEIFILRVIEMFNINLIKHEHLLTTFKFFEPT